MAELQARMSSFEFSQWAAYDKLEPVGEPRADMRFAMLMALTAEAYRDHKRQPQPFAPADFIPWFWAEDARQKAEADPGDLWGRFKAWALAMGAKKTDGNP